MNLNVLGELLDNSFLVIEKAREQGLDEKVTLDVIKQIIEANGDNTILDQELHPHYELVINGLYQNKIESKTKWRDRMIELAKHVSEWSRDKSKVGAVLVSKKGGDITLGYNGFPFGVKDDEDRYDEKKLKLNIIVHAEVNAIIASGSRAADGHLYVVGKPICARCAGPIIQSGIKRVFATKPQNIGEYEPPKDPNATDWEEIGRLAITMLEEAGVECIFYEATTDGYKYSDF
ncbi:MULTISPECIES: deaminase [Vibrio]|uniref:Deaminase n=1 Tax=Vibrio splendidus TaxID=29497 RepID=A0AB35N4J3_VIBSP|nr:MULTISPECIES: deaminase [Vibrio]MCF7504765.1 deaminase [Vibrio sp. L3-7]MDH5924693.1 deaminase [Vibrio lentus]MDP2503265.1 deaminase [Vibrio splendidus]